MKIPMQMGGGRDVAFSYETGISNFNSRTRILKDRNIITAYVCVTSSVAIDNSGKTLMTLTDSSLAPSAYAFSVATSSSGVFTLAITTSGEIKVFLRTGTAPVNGYVFGQISWTIGE